ncbi:hypothetical protein F5148DRAFT_1279424 [Russula earlei]|uniref:Uncharacterized protein n=1 Tax=Russula earlei TaxID=71964 RepID=A0ACC0UPA5_9AGAM|nr:hypothetical protein F5148DRAFT_1279424 [Russula earlei]
MPDPRFTRLKSDPRFRNLKRHKNKVVVDSRFSSVFSKTKEKSKIERADKYGRRLSDSQEHENLRRFYRLDSEHQLELPTGPDYARGEVLLESSDDEDEGRDGVDHDRSSGCDDDDDGVVTLGTDVNRPIPVPQDEDDEVDLNEDEFPDTDAWVAPHRKPLSEGDQESSDRTRRIAVVDLDWDHVRATHLYRIFTSAIASVGSSSSSSKGGLSPAVRGKVLSVRIYPSRFGLERMAHEENGPPSELFKKRSMYDEEDVNERTIYEIEDADEYDEDALRKYQLQRLRYFYAIVECDTVQLASYLYSELEGAELERSANVLNLSFVPDDMTFEEECRLCRPILSWSVCLLGCHPPNRDQATSADETTNYQPLDFATDALRHSKVKLTWDQDDPERDRVTRRALSLKEIEEDDFRAYIASSTDSASEDETKSKKKIADRDKLRALLLGSGGNDLPEGWAGSKAEDTAGDNDDVDMEVTFRPALSGGNDEDETTIDKYQRKMREKRKKRKQELKDGSEAKPPADDFFSRSDAEENSDEASRSTREKAAGEQSQTRRASTKEELSLLVAQDQPDSDPKHFDMMAIIKAEKSQGKKLKRKGRKKTRLHDENELQDDFAIDVKDERFKALHEDHSFAIDPSNPHFKKTKSMSALLEERSKRKNVRSDTHQNSKSGTPQSLTSLIESVKRKDRFTSHDGCEAAKVMRSLIPFPSREL